MKSILLNLLLCLPLLVACQSKAPLTFQIPKELVEAALRSPPNVYWASTSATTNEANGSVQLELRLSAPSPLSVRVPVLPVDTMPGFTGATAEFPPGSTSTMISIPVPRDGVINSVSPRIFNLQLGLPDYANQGLPGILELRVIDDDRPVVRFSSASLDVAENQGSVTLTAISDRPIPGSTPVTVAVAAPTPSSGANAVNAVAGSDFTLPSGGFTFQPGSKSASISVTILNNSSINPIRNALFTLSRSDGSVYNIDPALGVSQVLIRDDDGPLRAGFAPATLGSISSTGSYSIRISESAGNFKIPVLLNRPSTSATTIPVTIASGATAIAGSDYVLLTNQVTIQAGNTRGEVSFSVVDNSNFKGNRRFALVLGTPNNGVTLDGITSVTVEIAENDPAPTVQFETSLITRNENSGVVEIPVSLSSLIASNVSVSAAIGSDIPPPPPATPTPTPTVNYLGDAVKGEDFTVSNSTLSIPAGSARGVFKITLLNDTLSEDTEAIIGAITAASALQGRTLSISGIGRTRVDIVDDDPNPVIQWSNLSQTVDESSGKAVVSANINQTAGKTVHVPFTLSGSGVAGEHYDLSPSEIIIPKGLLTGSIEIPLIRDPMSEPDKTLILTLTGDGNATPGAIPVHTLTLTDSSGFTPTLAAFQTTVYKLVRDRNCQSCHSPTGSKKDAAFASDNLQEAFDAALFAGRTNFTDIPASKLVVKMVDNHQGFKTRFPTIDADMIAAIQAWKNISISGGSTSGSTTTTGSGTTGRTPVTLSYGSVGIQDYLQTEASFSSATNVPTPPNTITGTYPLLRDSISSDGDPLGISAPMAGAYIGLGAHYCKIMIDDVAGTGVNKRGFDRIQGLSNFKVSAAGFTPAMQAQVGQRLAEMFWQRPATDAEIQELQALVTDLRASNSSLSTATLGLAMCASVAGSVESIDN